MSARWKINKSRKHADQLIVIGPYDDDFRQDLLRSIPESCRFWDAQLKAWRIKDTCRACVEECIARHSPHEDET
jgi:hypothetical protein